MPPRVNGKSNRSVTSTKERLLAKAEVLFARHGFEGTALSELVKAAGVNKRMIYHYFGDKEGLYKALFAQHWLDLRAALEAAPAGNLADLLDVVFAFLSSHPRFTRLLMWDGLEGGKVSRSLWRDVRGPLFAATAQRIRAAQQTGSLSSDFDPGRLVVSFLGAMTFYFGYANSLGDLLGLEDPLAEPAVREYGVHLRRLAEGLTR